MVARKIFVISDLHLGGQAGDDPKDRGFRLCSPDSARTLTKWVDGFVPAPHGPKIELVINGDFVDFLAETNGDPPVWTPFESNEPAAVKKFETIVSRDRDLFDAFGRFLARGHRLVLLLGNHDVELALPSVRRALMDALHVTGQHDFEFIYDGEAYVVGSNDGAALIEHGNRYDRWNTVNHDALRELRAWQSRRQPAESAPRFEPCAGSRLVCDVINPIKARYRFVDLLKPETAVVLPLLLALEPGYRDVLPRIARLCAAAWTHRMTAPARPGVAGDIAASGTARREAVAGAGGARLNPVAGELAATSGMEPIDRRGLATDESLLGVLEGVMPGQAAAFLAAIERNQDAGIGIGGDIAATRDSIHRAVGLLRLLLSGRNEAIERQLRLLLQAIRIVQNDRTFDPHVETLPEYLDAATDLSRGGFRFVLFGHTHLPRNVDLGAGARYLNSGTWADVIRFPSDILGGSEKHALDALKAFVLDMAAGRLSGWVSFAPTYVRLDVDTTDRVVGAQLIDLHDAVL